MTEQPRIISIDLTHLVTAALATDRPAEDEGDR